MVMTGGWFIIVLTTLYPICIALPLPASPGEIHLDPGSAPLLPAGPVGVDPGGHCGAAVGGAASEAGLAARCGWRLLRILLGKFGKGVGKSKYFFYTK